ncbi:MAG: hypothetical protein IJV40_12455 [Oscillospiraceae bacterium]|nr:hypothetical protein [Oscillospiraceae bacterium]
MGIHRQKQTVPVLSVLLLLLLASLLCSACGNAADTSGLSGLWRLDAVENGIVTVPDSTVEQNRLLLRLDPDGSGMLYGGETEGRITWRYEQGKVILQTGTALLTGYADENGIRLYAGNSDSVLHFVPDTGEAASASTVQVSAEAFLGDWYGWWRIDQSTGTMPVSWYDCCAEFVPEEDGSVRMIFWDEDGSWTEALAEITFRVREDGTLVSQNGYFLYREVKEGDWKLKIPAPAIYIANVEHEEENEQFHSSIYLRPWGDRWDDSPEEQKPFYFDDWYLPLVKSGEEMPDRIPWARLEEYRELPKNETEGLSDGS